MKIAVWERVPVGNEPVALGTVYVECLPRIGEAVVLELERGRYLGEIVQVLHTGSWDADDRPTTGILVKPAED